MTPKVSVVMPCRNALGTIDEAVQSILAQEMEDLELIVVDDGSTDQTAARLVRWGQLDPRVVVLRNAASGIIPALNVGIEAAKAPMIGRMDADDIALPDRLAKQVAWLDEHPEVALVGCLVRAFPDEAVGEGFRAYVSWLNSLITAEDIAREIFVESPLAHPSVVIRSQWLDRMGGYQDFGWPEDYDLWLRMHVGGAFFGKVPEHLLLWREHSRRATRTDSRYSVENFLRAKARYLTLGPLKDREDVIVWGAGQMGRRLSKHLLKEGVQLLAFVDIDPKKIGREKRGRPIIAPEDLMSCWSQARRPALIVAVGSRGARQLIRARLQAMGLQETVDWWAAA